MSFDNSVKAAHPTGELEKADEVAESENCTVETYAGKVRIRWDDSAAVTAMGQMPVFIDFLKTSGRWDALVADCPLRYTSPNAPSQVDVLGTLLMSVLAGQSRYAHITGLRGDGVNPELLGMRKVMSEDSSLHAEATKIQVAVKAVAGFLSYIRSITEQLTAVERWRLILRAVVRAFPLKRAMKMPAAQFQPA